MSDSGGKSFPGGGNSMDRPEVGRTWMCLRNFKEKESGEREMRVKGRL